MKKLKLIFASLLMLFTLTIVPVSQAAAANVLPVCSDPTAQTTDVCKSFNSPAATGNPIIHIIKTVIEVLSYVIGALAIIFILVSTIRMITSGGDAQAAASARSGFSYALIGIAIAILAQVIVAFVLDKVK